jgi:hypothetical protein
MFAFLYFLTIILIFDSSFYVLGLDDLFDA